VCSHPNVSNDPVYVVDIRNCLYILRDDSRRSGEVAAVGFLEGSASLGDPVRLDAWAATHHDDRSCRSGPGRPGAVAVARFTDTKALAARGAHDAHLPPTTWIDAAGEPASVGQIGKGEQYMKRTLRVAIGSVLAIGGLVIGGLGVAAPASAAPLDAVSTFTYTRNMHPLGFSARENTESPFTANSDLAFWGKLAVQGNYDGFRLIDITEPDNPVELLDYRGCAGNQGDVLIWGNILIRSWNSPARAGATCGGQPVAPGFEGLHVFDISDRINPRLVASVTMNAATLPTPGCGSHTATLVPDIANGALYVYNSASSGLCAGIDIVKIPLANPADAAFLHRAATGRRCHDTGVVLGTAMLAGCAGGDGFTVLSLGGSAGGTIENPAVLYSFAVPGVTVGHSAAFTWDGKVLVFGHEPGGGGQARCQETSSATDRSLFFFNARTGAPLGTFVHPRPQTATENCTWHNYNVVPVRDRYLLVSGNYQSGVSVLDFTDPANGMEIAYADPAPLSTTTLIAGGDWSTYWYNGLIYESDITRGLIDWNLSSSEVANALRLDHLNPQTVEFTLD
jgi:hypothetical protein